MNDNYTVQLVEHVNYTAFVEADSQERAEALAATHTNNYSWTRMDGPNPTEICIKGDGDYMEAFPIKHTKDQL